MKGNPSALPSSFCFAILEEQHLENLSHHRMELNLRGKKNPVVFLLSYNM